MLADDRTVTVIALIKLFVKCGFLPPLVVIKRRILSSVLWPSSGVEQYHAASFAGWNDLHRLFCRLTRRLRFRGLFGGFWWPKLLHTFAHFQLFFTTSLSKKQTEKKKHMLISSLCVVGGSQCEHAHLLRKVWQRHSLPAVARALLELFDGCCWVLFFLFSFFFLPISFLIYLRC